MGWAGEVPSPLCAQGGSADCKGSRSRKNPKCHSCSCYWQLFSYHQREFIAPLTDAEIQKLELKAKGIDSKNKNTSWKKIIKDIYRKSPPKPSHFSAHITWHLSMGRGKRELSPHADVCRSVCSTPGSCSVLNQRAAGNDGEFGHKIPSGHSGSREDFQGRGPWNQAYVVLKSFSNTRYLHSQCCLMKGTGGAGLSGISVLAHRHTFSVKASLIPIRLQVLVPYMWLHSQESPAQLLWLLPRTGNRTPVLYTTRGSNTSPPNVTHGPVHMDTLCTRTATWSLWP